MHTRGVIPKARAFTGGPRDLAALSRSSPRDPSLRLKDGFARDDAIEVVKIQTEPTPIGIALA
jgi:hypothetical protein